MRHKLIGFTVLGLMLILGLSGCFSHRFVVMHNPDGSGKLTIETIFTEDYLGMIDDDLLVEGDDDIFGDSMFSEDDLAESQNIRSVTEESFVDSETGALHEILEIEIINILEPILFDQGDEYEPLFEIVDLGDGTYRFTVNLEAPPDFTDDGMDDDFMMDPEMFRFMLQGSTITWQLNAAEFIEGDPLAVYDVMNEVVVWEFPMYDLLFAEEPLEIYAIYRVDSAEIAEPEPHEVLMPTPDLDTPDQDIPEPVSPDTAIRPPVDLEVDQPSEGLFGMPRWVTIVAVAVLCLGVIFVIIAAGVIILVVRKRKQNQAENPPEQGSN